MRKEVFISYSHKDVAWMKRFKTVLTPLTRNDKLEYWVDTQIKPGTLWYDEIKKALGRAKVGVMLVSADFLASDFIVREEIPALLRAAKQDGATIIWIPIRDSLYTETEIADFQAAWSPDKPLAGLKKADADKALVEIAMKLKEAFNAEK
jgi:hypothetical protein